MIRDRKHWEFSVGRWHVGRWCSGAPCALAGGRHPIFVVRVRKTGAA